MTIPLPVRSCIVTYLGEGRGLHYSLGVSAGERLIAQPIGTSLDLFTADQLRAYGEAVRAEEREWWREIAEQLIACHDEPTCPAVTLARERLAGLCTNGVELWIDACPHCGKPRPVPPAPAAVPPGYVLVPIEPTPEMVDAGDVARHSVVTQARTSVIYRAMIAAAGDKP